MTTYPSLVGKTYFVRVFGCQMNLHDGERVGGILDACGCLAAGSPDEADIVVIMTCSVREKADTKLYGRATSVVSLAPPPSGRRVLAIGGCIAQRDGELLVRHVPNVDVVFGTSAISELPRLLEDALEGHGHGPFVDVEEEGRGLVHRPPQPPRRLLPCLGAHHGGMQQLLPLLHRAACAWA